MRTCAPFVSIVLLGSALAASADEVTIQVGHNSLKPSKVAIKAGDTVTFENEAEMPGGHTIVAADGSFSSPPLEKGGSWSHQFKKSGTHVFHIKEHPEAKGEIVVK